MRILPFWNWKFCLAVVTTTIFAGSAALESIRLLAIP
jgi:hypothetical protein